MGQSVHLWTRLELIRVEFRDLRAGFQDRVIIRDRQVESRPGAQVSSQLEARADRRQTRAVEAQARKVFWRLHRAGLEVSCCLQPLLQVLFESFLNLEYSGI